MKYVKKFVFFVAAILIAAPAFADDALVTVPSSIELKQGFLVRWDNPQGGVENLTTVTIARTHAIPEFGKWNALWDGWTIDAGFAYDGSAINTGAVLVGREFGTLGNYLPIDFPLKDQLKITVYPFGIEGTDIFDNPSIHGASGLGIIKFDVSF